MSRLFFLPIEPLPSRYTEQMLRWVTADLDSMGFDFEVIAPDYQGDITSGQFLDNFGTFRYKAQQLAMMADAFAAGRVTHGSILLLGDIWFPGIEQLRAMAELARVKVIIGGWHYAGVYDPTDYYAKELGAWSRAWETNVLRNIADAVCVGCSDHAHRLRQNTGIANVFDYGLVWNPLDVLSSVGAMVRSKQNIVVFPHRLTPEKNPAAFIRVANRLHLDKKFADWRWVISTPRSCLYPGRLGVVEIWRHETKRDYYKLLADAKIVYSSAHQETFGYAVNEGIVFGCAVVAPWRLSYPDVLNEDDRFLYESDDPDGERLLAARMSDGLVTPVDYTMKYAKAAKRFLRQLQTLALA